MTKLAVFHDFETYSRADIRLGAFRYASDPSTDVLMMSWLDPRDSLLYSWVPALDVEPDGASWDFDIKADITYYGRKLPKKLVELVENPEVEFHAHNAQFEAAVWWYVLVRRYGAPHIEHTRFVCTAVQCAASGLPRALGQAAASLGLGIQKDKEGGKLIQIFCKPQKARKPTKANPAGVPERRIMPTERLGQFMRFLMYNVTDVMAEIEVAKWVPRLSAREQAFYGLDMLMNMRGLPFDMPAVHEGLDVVTELEYRNNKRVTELTGGIRPTQRDKMLEFFNGLGLELENLQSKTVKDLLLIKADSLTDDQKELLMLRVEGGKASTKKLKTIAAAAMGDGRVRGSFLFHGAHPGRWAGRIVQPQNFTRGEYKPAQLESLIELVMLGDADILEMLFEFPIDAVAQGMRGFIKPAPGKKFIVCDFSAIEARMLAWLADETEVLKIYAANGDVYVRMAAKLYKRDEQELLKLIKCADPDKKAMGQRKFAKDIVLGAGYQMGGLGFFNNCVKRGILVGLEESKEAIKAYREGHPAIVRLWSDVERCAIQAVKQRRTKDNAIVLRHLAFYMLTNGEHEWLCVRLPSGRPLRYYLPKLQSRERFGKTSDQLTYRSEFKGRLIRDTTYGGKLVENITQAVARDVMVESMWRAEKHGYCTVGTVHDELIAENDLDFGSAHELENIMNIRPKWCQDAPINSEGWQGPRYRK